MSGIDNSSRTVLIVDDNPENLMVLSQLLAASRYEVLIATDGEMAIEQAEYAKPDLILLDVIMPGIDGFETCRRIKANSQTRDIPIIFMTALNSVEDKVNGFSAGAVDYITKPFQAQEVLARTTVHLQLRNLTAKLACQNELLQQTNAELLQEICDRKRTEAELRESEAIAIFK